jgi:hypothetical protein
MSPYTYKHSTSLTPLGILRSLDIIRLADGVKKTGQIQAHKGMNGLGAHLLEMKDEWE